MTDEPQSQIQLPSPGRIVLYESATGSGVKYPAIVLRTRKSTDPEIIERWGPNPSGEEIPKPEGLVAELPDDYHIDLLIHGLGSDYREFNVPHPSAINDADIERTWGTDLIVVGGTACVPEGKSAGARTWDYPPRV